MKSWQKTFITYKTTAIQNKKMGSTLNIQQLITKDDNNNTLSKTVLSINKYG